MAQQATRRSYMSGNLDRMQREAVARVREMQQRISRQEGGETDPRFRNWSTDPNIQRQNRAPHRQEEEPTFTPPPPMQEEPPHFEQQEPHGPQPNRNHYRGGGGSRRPQQNQPHGQRQEPRQQAPPSPPPEGAPQKNTTVLQDILGAVGLDDDRILILGLILLLINDKADTTLILALGYLLL